MDGLEYVGNQRMTVGISNERLKVAREVMTAVALNLSAMASETGEAVRYGELQGDFVRIGSLLAGAELGRGELDRRGAVYMPRTPGCECSGCRREEQE